MKLFKRRQPKYKIGDKVKFVYCYDKLFTVGTIWDVETSFLFEPVYQIMVPSYIDKDKFGNNHKVTESKIIGKVEV